MRVVCAFTPNRLMQHVAAVWACAYLSNNFRTTVCLTTYLYINFTYLLRTFFISACNFYFDLLAFDKMIVCTHLCVGHWTNGLTLDCNTQRRVNVDNPFKSPTKCAKQHFFFCFQFYLMAWSHISFYICKSI